MMMFLDSNARSSSILLLLWSALFLQVKWVVGNAPGGFWHHRSSASSKRKDPIWKVPSLQDFDNGDSLMDSILSPSSGGNAMRKETKKGRSFQVAKTHSRLSPVPSLSSSSSSSSWRPFRSRKQAENEEEKEANPPRRKWASPFQRKKEEVDESPTNDDEKKDAWWNRMMKPAQDKDETEEEKSSTKESSTKKKKNRQEEEPKNKEDEPKKETTPTDTKKEDESSSSTEKEDEDDAVEKEEGILSFFNKKKRQPKKDTEEKESSSETTAEEEREETGDEAPKQDAAADDDDVKNDNDEEEGEDMDDDKEEEEEDNDAMEKGEEEGDGEEQKKIIVINGPPSPFAPQQQQQPGRRGFFQRPSGMGHPSHTMNPFFPPQQPQPIDPNAAVLESLSAVVSIVSVLAKISFYKWIARKIANMEESHQPKQHFVWERLNDQFNRDTVALNRILQAPPRGVKHWWWNWRHKSKALSPVKKEKLDLSKVFTRTVVVVDVDAIGMEQLPSVVTFLLHQHRAGSFGRYKATDQPMELEVLFKVESPGGPVTTYGLAAEQLRRLRGVEGVTTTACVDLIAASGGYMIASQAEKLLAAPFSILGSIGVVYDLLNYHEIARKFGVRPVTVKSGTSKNRVTEWGEVKKSDLRREEEDVSKIHDEFRNLIVEARPKLKSTIIAVGDGSTFTGQQAVALNLVDDVISSDEYILERIQSNDRVLQLHMSIQSFMPRGFMTLHPRDLLPSRVKSWATNITKGKGELLWSRLLRAGGFVVAAQQVSQFLAAAIGSNSNYNAVYR